MATSKYLLACALGLTKRSRYVGPRTIAGAVGVCLGIGVFVAGRDLTGQVIGIALGAIGVALVLEKGWQARQEKWEDDCRHESADN